MQSARSSDEADGAPLGGAELLTPDGRSLPLVAAKLRVLAGGGLARVVLEQTFENPYDDTLRVTYKMPLPVDGAVSGYAFRIGTRTITGRVDRKETARARFEAAILQGKTAALLEQNKADIFTQEIGNIPARQTIVCEITVDQRLAWRPEGEWELRFPTVIGPRYIGANVTPEDRRASHVELADGSVRGRVHLEVKITDAITQGRRAESPSHALQTRGDGVVELLDASGGRLDRDVILRWAVATREIGMNVQTARPAGAAANGRNAYALVSIFPPAPDAGFATMPRDLIVLLDTSGSMGGGPLEQGKRVVAALIDSLSEIDRLEVIEFSMRANRYTKSPVPGTKREKEKAIAWVMNREASGGTEMQSAIVDALHGLRPGAQRQVVLVTDGYVGGEEQIVTLLHESLPESCRMHVVGVGSGVNRALAASLARAGRGAEVLVALDEDAEKSAKSLVDRTHSPIVTDLVISGDAVVDCSPEHLPDVFAGAPVLAALSVRASGGELIVRGNLARRVWEQRVKIAATDPGDGNPAVVKLYGRERVADLEMRWSIGNEVQAIDREIESIGLVFQIATRRTSWVAIDDDRSVDPRRGTRHEEIPQEVPYGTTMASFGAAMPSMTMTGAMSVMLQGFATPVAPAMGRMLSSEDDESARTLAAPMRAVRTPYPSGAAAAPPPRPAAMMPRSEAPSLSGPSSTDDEADERTAVTGSQAIPREPDTLRAPPPAQGQAPSPQPAYSQLRAPSMPSKIATPVMPMQPVSPATPAKIETPASLARPVSLGAPAKTNRWLHAIIAMLVALVLILAGILAWVLSTR
jgi:Ca-activated chloride channel family protein